LFCFFETHLLFQKISARRSPKFLVLANTKPNQKGWGLAPAFPPSRPMSKPLQHPIPSPLQLKEPLTAPDIYRSVPSKSSHQRCAGILFDEPPTLFAG
jgi:hypothetical protein